MNDRGKLGVLMGEQVGLWEQLQNVLVDGMLNDVDVSCIYSPVPDLSAEELQAIREKWITA